MPHDGTEWAGGKAATPNPARPVTAWPVSLCASAPVGFGSLMRLPVRLLCALVLAAFAPALVPAQTAPAAADQTRLLRFPATNGNQIVFSYAGQLYTVGLDGGTARRLTDGPGYAIFPRFSADGRQLAFTAQYDGNTEVYIMPADGGTPKRLTYTATLARDDLSDRMGPNNIVFGWKNTTPEIAFRSRMVSPNDFIGQLYTVGLDAELPKQLPVPRGGFLSFSPDDTKMAYNRVFREFRTWKHYKGGMADDIWIFDLKSGALENITNNDAQDIIPMWAPNKRIYFLSERDGRFNLYSYDLGSKQTRQHTTFKDYDIKFPSLGRGGIVFEQAGFVWHFDLSTEKARRVPIAVREDLAIGRDGMVNVSKNVTRVRPAPDGHRAVVVARGEIFSVPAKNGPVRALTNNSAAHERDASWSPDGKWIAYISDETGENELWIRAQDGKSPAQQITRGADTYYFTPAWSPDSKKLLWGDRRMRLRFVDVASKEVTLVEKAENFEITEREWSPDSQWIVYRLPGMNGSNVRNDYGKVRLYSVAEKTAFDVTNGWFSDNAVAFSDDGKFLTLASNRDFTPTFGNLEYNHVYRDQERVHLIALARATASPLRIKSDEVEVAGDEDTEAKEEAAPETDAKSAPKQPKAQPDVTRRAEFSTLATTPRGEETTQVDEGKKKPAPDAPAEGVPAPDRKEPAAKGKAAKEEPTKKAPAAKTPAPKNSGGIAGSGNDAAPEKKLSRKKIPVVKIDRDGLTDRVIALPIEPSNYGNIRMIGEKVYYTRFSSGRSRGAAATPAGAFCLYDFKTRKETELLIGVSSVAYTADGKKVLVTVGSDYAIIDLPTAKAEIKDKLDLSGLEVKLQRAAEWRQIFDEGWRQMRDYFYVANMHGVDWPATREKYAALLPYVRHRNDLTYIMGEMIAELNVGHAYVGGGDRANEAPRIKQGLLGAEFSRDAASRAYRIDRILRGENWQDKTRSPLTELGVDVKEGDFILAVDGKPVRDLPNLNAALVGTVGKQVTLRVNAQPTDAGAREVVVTPIADESPLTYYGWVQKNIAYVNEKTGGKVGYVHIPDMGATGLNEFVKYFYPQLTKRALIVDDRGNAGGNVSGQIAERLARQLVGVNMYRDSTPFTTPDQVFVGPMVCLLNEFSASDGDIFPFRFRALGLGKLVGKRSWGGVVGIRGSLPLVDGGTMTRPEFTFYSVDGKQWMIEGHGVDPDIVVDNDPWKEFHGVDQQLEKAIEVALEELKTKERALPPPPPAPVRN
jgi:tricorn protease